MILDDLLNVLRLFRIYHCVLIVFFSLSFLFSAGLDPFDFLCHLGLVPIKLDFLVCPMHALLQACLSHLLVIVELLCQVVPLKPAQVLQVPHIVVVVIVALLPADKLAVQGQSRELGILFPLKFDPALRVVSFAIATGLFACASDVLCLSLQVDATELKLFRQELSQVVSVHERRHS